MNNLRLTLRTFAVFAFTLLFVSGVQAQAIRTWVSGTGDDLNPCSFTAPCRTFAGAISKTATGGEITVKDAGGIWACDNQEIDHYRRHRRSGVDSRQSSDGDYYRYTTRLPGRLGQLRIIPRVVRIRGLSINGAGSGINGINVIAASKVSVEDCVIDGFTKHGINVQAGTLYVSNTTIRNNAGAGINVTGAAQAGIC